MGRKTTKSSKQEPEKKALIPLNKFNPSACGIDVGASSVFVCAPANGELEIREYSTFTGDLKAMVGWLKSCKVTSCAMESTGVYWIPIFDIIEESGIEVILVNAHHVKTVPGRKTDVKDCQWIQQLHSYGLLSGSFRPTKEILPLRAFVRQRSRLFEKGAQELLLMQKALTQMNVRLKMVVSDISGLTGMRIIKAIIDGERNPYTLASLRDYRCQKDKEEIAKGLEGTYQQEHVFALKQSYEAYQFFHTQISECEINIEKELNQIQQLQTVESQSVQIEEKEKLKGRKTIRRNKTIANRSAYYFDAPKKVEECTGVNLLEIPGMEANTLVKILSEIGTDMSRWPTVDHFVSWLGLCPGNKVSGGKVLNSRTKSCSNRVAQALRVAAHTLYRSQTALGSFFRRMRSKFGAPKAITATAHKMARIIYHMLTSKKGFRELGGDYYENQYRERVLASLKRRAKEFGFDVVPLPN
ncbi:MAG: IS110 family transposase [Candidatus Babeliales bacterium]